MATLIELRGISRIYRMGDTEVRALDGVDLVVEEGEFLAIVGPSGSGKSTLMYLLGCLDRPSAGTYRLGGVDVASLDDAGLSRLRNREIGYIFQSFNLLPDLTVIDNVCLGLVYAGEDAARARATAQRWPPASVSASVSATPRWSCPAARCSVWRSPAAWPADRA